MSPENTASIQPLPEGILESYQDHFGALHLIYKIQYIELSIFMVPKVVHDRGTVNPRAPAFRLPSPPIRTPGRRRGKRPITGKRTEIGALQDIARRNEA